MKSLDLQPRLIHVMIGIANVLQNYVGSKCAEVEHPLLSKSQPSYVSNILIFTRNNEGKRAA